jgi:hypothetical protein
MPLSTIFQLYHGDLIEDRTACSSLLLAVFHGKPPFTEEYFYLVIFRGNK